MQAKHAAVIPETIRSMTRPGIRRAGVVILQIFEVVHKTGKAAVKIARYVMNLTPVIAKGCTLDYTHCTD